MKGLMDNLLTSSIEFTDGGFVETQSILGEVTRRFTDVRAAQYEEAVRKSLIALGWTPPPNSDER